MKKTMGKEITFAVISGLIIALIITFIIYFRSNQEEINQFRPSPTPTPITKLPDKTDNPINITFPDNEVVFEDRSLTVTGNTFPLSPIIIFLNQKDFFTQSNEQGDFSFDLNLESGSNHLIVTTIDDQGTNYSDERIVIHTNKSLEEKLISEDEVTTEDLE